MRRKVISILIFMLAAMIAANAQEEKPFSIEDFDAKPFSGAREDYFDLIEKVFPGARVYDETNETPENSQPVELRKLSGEAEKTIYKAPFGVLSASVWWFRAGGERHLALLIDLDGDAENRNDFGSGPVALAVFRMRLRATRGGESLYDFELTDAVDPQTDRFTSFASEFPLLDENRKNQFFWLVNSHFNAGENFTVYETVRVGEGGRLEIAIEKMPGRYVSMDCSDNTADFFSISRKKIAARNALPYDFRLRTLFIAKHECRRESKRKKAVEQMRIYRARRTSSRRGRRSGWRLVLVAKRKRTVTVLRDKDY